MLKKSEEFLYETQNQKRPTFRVYLAEYKTLAAIAIAFVLSMFYGFYTGIVAFVIYLWYDFSKITLTRKAKLTSRTNLLFAGNSIVEKFYKYTNTDLIEMLAKKILIEKKEENNEK